MSLASPQESRIDRFWRRASALVPERYRQSKHGDSPDGRDPYALIHVHLFKPQVGQVGQSEYHNGLDDRVCDRTVEGIERVIRINRHSHLFSLIDLGEGFFFPLACCLAGWAAGFATALEVVSRFHNP
jgi:hypothetical protein